MALAAAREQLQTVRLCPTDYTRNDFRRNVVLVNVERYFHYQGKNDDYDCNSVLDSKDTDDHHISKGIIDDDDDDDDNDDDNNAKIDNQHNKFSDGDHSCSKNSQNTMIDSSFRRGTLWSLSLTSGRNNLSSFENDKNNSECDDTFDYSKEADFSKNVAQIQNYNNNMNKDIHNSQLLDKVIYSLLPFLRSIIADRFLDIEILNIKRKVFLFLPQLKSIYSHYCSRKNVFYRGDDDDDNDYFQDNVNVKNISNNNNSDSSEHANLGNRIDKSFLRNATKAMDTNDSSNEIANHNNSNDKEELVLYQLWQYIKESHLICRSQSLASINRFLNTILEHDGVTNVYDDDIEVHKPTRGPITFENFISITLWLIHKKVMERSNTMENFGSCDSMDDNVSTHNKCNGTKSKKNNIRCPRISQSFVLCMESLILKSSCGQNRPNFYSRYYDVLTQKLLSKELGLIEHIYCYFRDEEVLDDHLPHGKTNNDGITIDSDSEKDSTATVYSGVAATIKNNKNKLHNKHSYNNQQKVNIRVRQIKSFADEFDLYQGMLTPHRLTLLISEVMGLKYNYDMNTTGPRKDNSTNSTNNDGTSNNDTTNGGTESIHACSLCEDEDELLFEEFCELICRIAIAHYPRFKALMTPLPSK